MPRPIDPRRGEVWATVPGHPGYWVSSTGRVRSRRGVLKQHPGDDAGHLAVAFTGRRHFLVHRLVAERFVPNPEGYPLVRHLDGDPANNDYRNLAWGTQAMNMADARRHGRLGKKVAA